MALQPPVSPDSLTPSPAHTAVYRRLTRAFADLGITPVTVDDGSPTWVRVANDNIAFGELSVATAARLATLLEDIAAGASGSSVRVPWEPMITGPEYDIAVSGPFVPVASPLAPAASSSRFHPSISS